jgi:hypothetical protein
LPVAGTYRVYLWHIVWGARGPVTIEIQHNGKAETLKRNTGDGHSGWNSLGDFDPTWRIRSSVELVSRRKFLIFRLGFLRNGQKRL